MLYRDITADVSNAPCSHHSRVLMPSRTKDKTSELIVITRAIKRSYVVAR